jgi:hypothetical protein
MNRFPLQSEIIKKEVRHFIFPKRVIFSNIKVQNILLLKGGIGMNISIIISNWKHLN